LRSIKQWLAIQSHLEMHVVVHAVSQSKIE